MTDFYGVMDRNEVNDPETFANWVHQTMGTPYPTGKQMAILKRRLKDFWKGNPKANWGTLVRTTEWCRNNRRRVAHSYSILSMVRYAFACGYLPELEPSARPDDASLEEEIDSALRVEKDEWWRDRLIAATGNKARKEVYESWVEMRSSSLSQVG